MPNGPVHTRATLITAVVLLRFDVGSLPVWGALAGLVLSPDLDVDHGFIGLRQIQKIWIIGRPLSIFWRAIWYPYAKLVSHRSWISHSPVVGTLIRLVYLGAVLSPIWYILSARHGFQLGSEWLPFVIGLMIVDTIHILMDLGGALRANARRKSRRRGR